MKNKDDSSRQANQLRRRAEQIARKEAARPPGNLETLEPEKTRQMFHELQVHQIELELQNEELRQSQAELDAARARYFDLYDLAPVGYVTLGERGLILEANLTSANMLGVARGELSKQLLSGFVIKEDQDIYYRYRKQLLETGESQACELRMVRKDGTQFWAHLDATVMENAGGLPVSRVTISDITVHKHAEDVIEKLNKELEDRILELKIKNKELETFSYAISHDLMTPLIAIEGFSRILIKKYSHQLDIKGQDHLMMINESSKRMNQLIVDLHDFFRLGRKNIQPKTIDMEKTVNDIVRDFKSMFPDDAFRVELGALPTAQADQKMIRQVLINLIGNAIKYSRPKSGAVVQIGGLTEKERNIYFVKDQGIGFSMEYADKIFKIFERLHCEDEFEGTGIGLAIVKRIIQMHGGDVWAEGVVDEGATFYFSLPRRESAE